MQALRKERPLCKSVLATTPSKGPPVPKSLLREPSEVSFPKDIAPMISSMISVISLWQRAIKLINQLIDMQSSLERSKARKKECADSNLCAGVTFSNFCLKSKSLSSSRKLPRNHVPLDPMPTSGSARGFGCAVTCDPVND